MNAGPKGGCVRISAQWTESPHSKLRVSHQGHTPISFFYFPWIFSLIPTWHLHSVKFNAELAWEWIEWFDSAVPFISYRWLELNQTYWTSIVNNLGAPRDCASTPLLFTFTQTFGKNTLQIHLYRSFHVALQCRLCNALQDDLLCTVWIRRWSGLIHLLWIQRRQELNFCPSFLQ